jgi:hypothetical protein
MKLSASKILFHMNVSLASFLHLFWAVLALFDPSVMSASTAMHALRVVFLTPGSEIAGLVVVAVLAIFGSRIRSAWSVLCLVPQFSLLVLSSMGVAESVILGQFARGLAASPYQIAADQIGIIIITISYGIAVLCSGMVYPLNVNDNPK